jgi:hypothetical protein
VCPKSELEHPLEVLFALPLLYHKRAVCAVWHDVRAVLMAALFEPFPCGWLLGKRLHLRLFP